MPELPEVESLVRYLRGRVVGKAVGRVFPVAVSVLKTYEPAVTELEGRVCGGVVRWGKFLDVEVGGLHLVMHLGRAGWVRWREEVPAAPPRPGKGLLALRVRLVAGDGFDVTEAGTRKQAAVYVVRDPREVPGVARLGPDPLGDGFTREAFGRLLAGERRQIKGVLRDQGVLAGIGNAYSDEILHVARMSPFRAAASLTDGETDVLYAAVGTTLTEAVARSGGLEPGKLKAEKKSGMRVHGRAGEACPVCGDTVREVVYRDRSMQYCPTCQTGGKILADRRMSRLLK
ncbi:Fpg/Nei family DNA glycosylase [Streptomyces catenulae]|uniref:DNA-formamidopyrimidine glycosylase family protein n=1 Tax=Streptomyces catenulae TaxID=66875 RepID=A0ABV2YWK8_9ACTN|nr:DNA-formamidopyrimidine glycosylase family protein [Streptomyces catenulae]